MDKSNDVKTFEGPVFQPWAGELEPLEFVTTYSTHL